MSSKVAGEPFLKVDTKVSLRLDRLVRRTFMAAATAFLALAAVPAAAAPARTMSIDDVLDLTRIDRIAVSPDGRDVAVVVLRPARPGEVYGRASYDLDPSRGNIWLISLATGERRNLTRGEGQAAGFWCPSWSPDGRHLAMLSTQPEGDEPHGGDNVRLYLWSRADDRLRRASDAPVMTQTRLPLYRLDVRAAAQGGAAAQCHEYENAPFTWIDDRRLLALMLPDGAVSGLIDEYQRPMRHAAETLAAMRSGTAVTATVSASGSERVSEQERLQTALLRTIGVDTGAVETIMSVPVYPFRGDLSLSLSPDRRRLALLATTGTIPPAAGRPLMSMDGNWSAERRLGFVDLAAGAPVRWANMPRQARYPLELFEWSPDSRRVALRARGAPDERATPLFIADARDLSVQRAAPDLPSVGGAFAGADFLHGSEAMWADERHLLVRSGPAARSDWWLVGPGATASANVTGSLAEPPSAFRRSANGRLLAIAGDRLMTLDPRSRRLEALPAAPLPSGAALIWPGNAGVRSDRLIVSAGETQAGEQRFELIPLADARAPRSTFTLPAGAELLHADPATGHAVHREPARGGLFLRATPLSGGPARTLLTLNTHLAELDWGRAMLIDYRGSGGEALQAAVILPPGYRPGERYPTLTWVYPGTRVRNLQNYFLDPHMAGFYNLYLYAARGYVVLVPSMPVDRSAERNDTLSSLAPTALAAVDRLVELGIADPDRIGVFGQSFGGYGVYGLVTQTNRFRAAVAMAGITNLTSFHNVDPMARGYQGIEHEKTDNAFIAERGQIGLGVPPWDDPALYQRNSPLNFVDRVETPLLLIHGEYDVRGPMSDAETFFQALYRQGKPARLLRYSGESHGLSQSPANVRDIFEETIAWFDRHLAPRAAPQPPER